MRASLVLGGAGTISGIASTTCGGDHVRVRRACLRCPHALLPCTALLSKRIKGDSFACAAGRGSAQSHRRRGRPKIGHARRWFNRDSQSSNALSAQRLAWREQPPRLSSSVARTVQRSSSDIHDQSERSHFGRRPHRYLVRTTRRNEALSVQWHCNDHSGIADAARGQASQTSSPLSPRVPYGSAKCGPSSLSSPLSQVNAHAIKSTSARLQTGLSSDGREMNGISGSRVLPGRPWRPLPPTWPSHRRYAPQMPRDLPGAAPFPGLAEP